MSFVSRTIGLVIPKYRTLNDWMPIYQKVILNRCLGTKTTQNKRSVSNHLLEEFGNRSIGKIMPHEIGEMIRRIHKDRPPLSKRVLQETRDIFNEAMNYGWIGRNPAATVKTPRVSVQRKRLTMNEWLMIHSYSVSNQPPWVSRMMTLALVTGQRRSDIMNFRFADIWDNHLHIEQQKTGTRLALPIDLKMDSVDFSIRDAIESCKGYSSGDEFLIRKNNGGQLVAASLSARFEEAREAVIKNPVDGFPPSLHECRSLSERMYRLQGIDTQTLLGHKHQSMTDLYNDDRGLSSSDWKVLVLR